MRLTKGNIACVKEIIYPNNRVKWVVVMRGLHVSDMRVYEMPYLELPKTVQRFVSANTWVHMDYDKTSDITEYIYAG